MKIIVFNKMNKRIRILTNSNQICQSVKFVFNSTANYSTKLAEVGRFEDPISEDNTYPSGQPFLHKIFGYRGVLLFPWHATINDNDIRKKFNQANEKVFSPKNNKETKQKNEDSKKKCDESSSILEDAEAAFGQFQTPFTRIHPYYQALIDDRDCFHVSNRTQVEAVTFLGHPDNSKSVYSIKGLDYVAHSDVMPYTSHEKLPIHHELYNKLFTLRKSSVKPQISENQYVPSNSLEFWKNKHPWLQLSKVYKETTEGIRITVIPFYLGCTEVNEISYHWWRYSVRLENLGQSSVQLRERHWKIFSQKNMLQTVKGRGVVGMEPTLSKREPAYQYSSHVNLQDASGHMWGTFKMEREDGHKFECRIPPFSLESTLLEKSTNN